MKISTLRNLRTPLTQKGGLGPFKAYLATIILILISILVGCRSGSHEPVTVTFVDPEWSHDARERSLLTDAASQEFTNQTGIRVKHLPAPESAPAQLALVRDLLQKQTPLPDVYGIDVIWPAMLSQLHCARQIGGRAVPRKLWRSLLSNRLVGQVRI